MVRTRQLSCTGASRAPCGLIPTRKSSSLMPRERYRSGAPCQARRKKARINRPAASRRLKHEYPNMLDYWNHLAQKRIEEAQEQGMLDDPAMHGKALDLTENPFVPEDQRLAFKLLKDNGLAPAWI